MDEERRLSLLVLRAQAKIARGEELTDEEREAWQTATDESHVVAQFPAP